jgi:hypothetical protein
VPVPLPFFVTESWRCWRLKVAVTVFAVLILTLHSLPIVISVQPAQETSVELGPGRALRTAVLPSVKGAEQVAPHSIPAGELITVPVPLPGFSTVSVCVAAEAAFGRMKATRSAAAAKTRTQVRPTPCSYDL